MLHFRKFVILSLIAAAHLGAGAGGVEPPWLRSAVTTEFGARSVLTAITRAGDRLVAVGERGIVIFSDDHGGRWQQAKVPVSVTLCAVRFIDKRQGWVVGHAGVVLATRDGGSSWSKQLDGR